MNFRTFLQYINKFVNVLFFISNNIIQTNVMLLYEKNKKQFCHKFNIVIIFIHIFCDIWTFLNHLIFIDVVVHFIEKTKIFRILLLNLKKIRKNHNDKNIIVIVLNIVRNFEFRNKLKYFVMNNVDSNDIIIKIITQNFEFKFFLNIIR